MGIEGVLMNNFCEYKFNIPEYVRTVLNRLYQNGEEAYIVGGSLRDMLLGATPHDFDLASSAEPLRFSSTVLQIKSLDSIKNNKRTHENRVFACSCFWSFFSLPE